MSDVSAVTVQSSHQPKVISTDPANNAVSVSTSKVVKFTFNEAVKKGNMWIDFKNSNGKSVKFTSNLTGKTLYLTPKSQLAYLNTYTIILHSNCVKDATGNGLAIKSTKFTTKQQTKTYSANGVSFDYPANWYFGSDIEDGNKCIYGTKVLSQISPQFQLVISTNPKDMTDQMAIEAIYNAKFPSGFKKISSQSYNLNSNKVYEIVYTITDKKMYSVIMETKEINIVKNHKTYTMYLTAPQKTFDNEKIDFNILKQNLKIT